MSAMTFNEVMTSINLEDRQAMKAYEYNIEKEKCTDIAMQSNRSYHFSILPSISVHSPGRVVFHDV